MPNTRAATRRLASKRKSIENTATRDDGLNNSVRHPHEAVKRETGMSILDNLREATSGVEKLYTQIRSLEKENGSFRFELQQVQHLGPGKRHAYYQKEVERDAKELADDHDGVVPIRQTVNLGESAIKLLQRMCDTIDMNTLAEAEECAICMEGMAVGKCYSLPCQHCVECFEPLGDGSDIVSNHQTGSVQCPHCREICSRGGGEIITPTAVQQWDLLLDISQQWATMSIGEIDIAEEDNENNYIDDGSVAATESPLTDTLGERADLDPESSITSTSPNDRGPVAYKSLPSPLKRKILIELVAQRAVKQSV